MDLLAVEAVICERVSVGGFPANREKYRENEPLLSPIDSKTAKYYGMSAGCGHLEEFSGLPEQGDNSYGAGAAGDVAGSGPFGFIAGRGSYRILLFHC